MRLAQCPDPLLGPYPRWQAFHRQAVGIRTTDIQMLSTSGQIHQNGPDPLPPSQFDGLGLDQQPIAEKKAGAAVPVESTATDQFIGLAQFSQMLLARIASEKLRAILKKPKLGRQAHRTLPSKHCPQIQLRTAQTE